MSVNDVPTGVPTTTPSRSTWYEATPTSSVDGCQDSVTWVWPGAPATSPAGTDGAVVSAVPFAVTTLDADARGELAATAWPLPSAARDDDPPDWQPRLRALEDGPAFSRFEEKVNWLRDEHGLSHGFATAIVHEADLAGLQTILTDSREESIAAARAAAREAVRDLGGAERDKDIVRALKDDLDRVPCSQCGEPAAERAD